MKLGIRAQEVRSQALKGKITEQHGIFYQKIQLERLITKNKLEAAGVDVKSEEDSFETDSDEACEDYGDLKHDAGKLKKKVKPK